LAMNGLLGVDQTEDDQSTADPNQEIIAEQTKFIRQVVELVKTMGIDNDTDVGQLTLFSPRILSITPEEARTKTMNLFSPSIFSLHDQGDGLEALLSVPKAVKTIQDPDYRQWMNLILEASGVPDVIEETHVRIIAK
uniref:DNA helicase n=1 Tax=Anisakis simplex TaxID=6269 RepID=A0A0M3JCT9_ANISI